MNFFDASRRQGVILSFGGDISENVLFSLGGSVRGRGVISRTALAGIGVAIGPCG
jgi:hypothetical protein